MNDKLVTFAHISDTHLHIDPNFTNHLIDYPAIPQTQKLIDFLNQFEADIDFVLHTGDVMHHPQQPEDYVEIRKIMDGLDYPTYYLTGNHDNVAWMQEHFLGRKPEDITPNYDGEFEVNGVQFIFIDSHTPPEIWNGVGVYHHEQLNWLDGLLSQDGARPLVVATHHHVLPTLAPWLDRIATTNGTDLHQLLLKAKHRLRGVFYGHIHETLITVRDGISYYSVQSGWYQTRTYHAQPEPSLDPLRNVGFNLVTLTEQDTFVRAIRIPD